MTPVTKWQRVNYWNRLFIWAAVIFYLACQFLFLASGVYIWFLLPLTLLACGIQLCLPTWPFTRLTVQRSPQLLCILCCKLLIYNKVREEINVRWIIVLLFTRITPKHLNSYTFTIFSPSNEGTFSSFFRFVITMHRVFFFLLLLNKSLFHQVIF